MLFVPLGFPCSTSGKEPACQCRRCKRLRFEPWVGKIPWRREWQPTPVFLPEESHGQSMGSQRDMTKATEQAHTDKETEAGIIT